MTIMIIIIIIIMIMIIIIITRIAITIVTIAILIVARGCQLALRHFLLMSGIVVESGGTPCP